MDANTFPYIGFLTTETAQGLARETVKFADV
jgi:hypothetical protein